MKHGGKSAQGGSHPDTTTPRPGHNVIAKAELRSAVSRIESVEGEIKLLNDDKRDIYAEAKGHGLDPAGIKAVVKIRRQDPEKREEQEAIVDTYLSLLGTDDAIISTRAPVHVRERLPRAAYQPHRLAPIGEIKAAHRSGAPINQDVAFVEGNIYFAHFPQLKRLKIGLSNDVEARLSQLEAGCGAKSRLVHSGPGNRQEELRALDAFAQWKLEGEWFSWNRAVEAAVQEYTTKHFLTDDPPTTELPRPDVSKQPFHAPPDEDEPGAGIPTFLDRNRETAKA